MVTLEETTLSLHGAGDGTERAALTLSGVLATDDPAPGTPINGPAGHLHAGHGLDRTELPGDDQRHGRGHLHHHRDQPVARPDPGDGQLRRRRVLPAASAASTVNLPEGTQLTITPTGGTYNGSTPVSGTLINTYTNQPVPNEPVTFTRERRPSRARPSTNANGIATCSVTPTEPAGSYSVTGTFPGDSTSMPQLIPTQLVEHLHGDAGPDDLHLHRHRRR